jgi:hypothetical protein
MCTFTSSFATQTFVVTCKKNHTYPLLWTFYTIPTVEIATQVPTCSPQPWTWPWQAGGSRRTYGSNGGNWCSSCNGGWSGSSGGEGGNSAYSDSKQMRFRTAPAIFEPPCGLVSSRIFVLYQRLIARNIAELFSFNSAVLLWNKACCINEKSRGVSSCLKN